jgi:hypothetical protein
MRAIRTLLGAMLACAMAPASAQLLGGGGALGGLGGVTGGLLGSGNGTVVATPGDTLGMVGSNLSSLTPSSLLSLRRDRLQTLVRNNRAELDVDDAGNPIRRDEIIGLDLSADSLTKARAAGFRVERQEAIGETGLEITVLQPPAGKVARKAIKQLQASDPAGSYTLDHIYEPARAPLGATSGPVVQNPDSGGGVPIGLIDGGVGNHPAFAGARIEQRGFAGSPQPSGHGTAIASLLVGRAARFGGAAPGHPLLVADIYCGSPANGSAIAIARAMAWLASRGVKVVNISLVGPANPLLAAGIKALQSRGVLVVAAVGNDGPASPPQYPASYPDVVAVTGVDAHDKVLIEAGRASHLDFAAPGADLAAAVPGGRWEAVRGTSFAAPLVAGSLARVYDGDGSQAIARLGEQAKPGRNVGRGIVCGDCRTPPRALGLR